MNSQVNLMALDLGFKRVGVAICSTDTNLPQPLVTLDSDKSLAAKLKEIISEHHIDKIIVGLPSNLESGQDTGQTKAIRQMAKDLSTEIGTDFIYQDEALSSVRAEDDLKAKGASVMDKKLIDKLAACYILEDYLKNNG